MTAVDLARDSLARSLGRGLRQGERKAPIVGRSNEGKPGTRKTRFGKKQQKWGR